MKGTAKGPPISSIIAEIFLQFYEHKFIKRLETNNLIYTLYVDDIYDAELITSNINHIHGSINSIQYTKTMDKQFFYIYYSQGKNL
jgi:NAD-dependent SIR2 family protein deacetylase